MIFIGPNLSNPNSHFVTNIVSSIGDGDDLLIDILEYRDDEQIYNLIDQHIESREEEFVIYSVKENETFFLKFREKFCNLKLIGFFSDDEWRHSNYNRYIALFCDHFTIAVHKNIQKYKQYGLVNVHYMRWGCNSEAFHPLTEPKKYDVTFVGSAYGKRIEYIRYLVEHGIKVKVFGMNWDKHSDLIKIWGGVPSHEELLKIISQSKINLNFLWTSRNPDKVTVKGRTMEIAACNAFQLSNYTSEFDNYGLIADENIAVFDSKSSMLRQVHRYLDEEELRKTVAINCYNLAKNEFTWKRQFENLYREARSTSQSRIPKYKVLVFNDGTSDENGIVDDHRMEITHADSNARDDLKYDHYDGVISLKNRTTLDNNGLYMMLFGLRSDNSDVVFANFYTGGDVAPVWVRFTESDLKTGYKDLPITDVTMFSGKYISKYGFNLGAVNTYSYIEYPVCYVELGFVKARLLRFKYGYIPGLRGKIKEFLNKGEILALFSLLLDKLWHKAATILRSNVYKK